MKPATNKRRPTQARVAAGFAINLVSALIAHFSMGDGPEALAPSAATSVLWGLSYVLWRRLQATPARAWSKSSF